MRSFILIALMAATAMPAIASAQQSPRGQNDQRPQDRRAIYQGQRAEPQAHRAPQRDTSQRETGQSQNDARRHNDVRPAAPRADRPESHANRPNVQDNRNIQINRDVRQTRPDQHNDRNIIVRTDPRYDRNDRQDNRREFRDDRRDAWKDYRNNNRNVYHRPRYIGPQGYRYQQWRPGVRIPSAYYGSRYLISDPWYYRLYRPTVGYLQWVRYGDDVLLVDVRTGMVRDVIHDFFW